MTMGAGQSANGQLVKGLGIGSRQWTSAFQLTDTNGTTALFQVDQSGNVTAAGTLTGSGTVDSGGNAAFAGTLAVTGNATFSTTSYSGLQTSTVAAGSSIFKFTGTNATPVVAFTGSGSTNTCPTTAPAGYLQVTNGSTVHYIPYWA